jgi:hypothetical protein
MGSSHHDPARGGGAEGDGAGFMGSGGVRGAMDKSRYR